MLACGTAKVLLPRVFDGSQDLVRLSHCDATKLHQIRGAVEAASKIKQKYRHVAYTPIKPTLPPKKRRGRRPRSFTSEETKNLIADYRAGVPVTAISKKFNCHRSTVQRILQVNGVERRTPDLPPEQVTALRKCRAEGATYAQLVKEFNVSKRTISKYTVSSAGT